MEFSNSFTTKTQSFSSFLYNLLQHIYNQADSNLHKFDSKKVDKEISDFISNLNAFFISEIIAPLKAIIYLADNQYITWDSISESEIKMFLSSDIQKVNEFLSSKNNEDTVFELINEISQFIEMEKYQQTFSESSTTFNLGLYNISTIGFLTIIDGLLSDVSSAITSVSIEKRFDTIIKKLESKIPPTKHELETQFLIISMYKMTETLSNFISFEDPEPQCLNRHWIMHGRNQRILSRLDCVKIMRYLLGLLKINHIICN